MQTNDWLELSEANGNLMTKSSKQILYDKMTDLFTNYQGRNYFSLANDVICQEIYKLEFTLNELDRARMFMMKSSNIPKTNCKTLRNK